QRFHSRWGALPKHGIIFVCCAAFIRSLMGCNNENPSRRSPSNGVGLRRRISEMEYRETYRLPGGEGSREIAKWPRAYPEYFPHQSSGYLRSAFDIGSNCLC